MTTSSAAAAAAAETALRRKLFSDLDEKDVPENKKKVLGYVYSRAAAVRMRISYLFARHFQM